MNMNAFADALYDVLRTKHTHVYRNKAPQSPTYPFIIYRVENVLDMSPSDDLYVHVDVYDDANVSVRALENLADLIDGDGDGLSPSGLNQLIIQTNELNAHFKREQRQHIPSLEIGGVQAVNLRYDVRVYFN